MNKEEIARRIAELRGANTQPPAQAPMSLDRGVLFFGTQEDRSVAIYLDKYFAGFALRKYFGDFSGLTSLIASLKKAGVNSVLTSREDVLVELVKTVGDSPKPPKISNYAGSLFTVEGVEFLVLPPLHQLFTVSYGEFVIERMISKITRPEKWDKLPQFKWGVLRPDNAEKWLANFLTADLISYDIETKREGRVIDIISFTSYHIKPTGLETATLVLEIKDEWSYGILKRFLQLPVPKGTQNGKYDNFYLIRYHVPATQWFWDSAYLFHSWLAELPKDLGFLNAFFLRNTIYWKDLSETNDRMEYFRYCALDSWTTGLVILAEVDQMPQWAKRNYLLKFRLQFPSLLCEHTGLVRDQGRLEKVRGEVEAKRDKTLQSLRFVLDCPAFNPGSHVQVKALMRLLGCEELATSSDETALLKAREKHPINRRVFDMILELRGLNKLISTYLRTDADMDKKGEGGAKEYRGQVLYSLNPTGTESGRNASRESSMWCGLQIQNIPAKYPQPKQTIRCHEGFLLAESDLEQAESRDTGYLIGDEVLIDAVENRGDFHSYNASRFFGVPYEEIYDEATGKKLRKDLRTAAKPINHGANYNMGCDVMVDNMTLPMVWQCKELLNLPFSQPTEITEYLLAKFHLTYTKLKGITRFRHDNVRAYLCLPKVDYKLYAPGSYYGKVADSVQYTGTLISRAYHRTEYNLKHHPDIETYISEGDWTRRCFGKPWKNKLDLNSYVAHGPQSLNARTLDEAFMEVFYKVALPNPTTFRLYAQIHDSILHGFKAGHEHLSEQVRKLMEIPVTIRDISGITRTFTVPAALKAGKDGKGVTYWSDTE